MKKAFFAKKQRWYQIYGLSYHLWNSENLTKLCDSVTEAVAIDRTTLELQQLDAARVKIKVQQGRFWFDPIEVTEGVKNYTITFTHGS